MRNKAFAVGLAVLAVGSPVFGQSTPAARPPKFAQIVTEHFDDWDRDHDGKLSHDEIDSQCVDATVSGPEAAAVAALKRIVRSEKYELPPLTKEYLTKPSAATAPNRPVRDTDREDSGEKPATPAPSQSGGTVTPSPADGATPQQRPPDWQSRYASCYSRIQRSDRALFTSSGPPSIDTCHQGPLGDCYFVSVVGAMVKRDAAAIRRMIQPLPAGETGGGGYTVTFGTGREVKVKPLTDAEIALSSTTDDKSGDDGIWLAVLEKAFGTMRLDDNPSRYTMETATDAIAKGGSTATTIRLLTGHNTTRISLKQRKPSTRPAQVDVNGKTIQPPRPAPSRTSTGPGPSLVLAADESKLAAKVRESVSTALSDRRLVAAGTADEKQPPGISGKHAYAVLAYDAGKDTLTIWNPHGNNFRPKGEAGLEFGYPTKAGIFELPVKEFVHIFQGVTIEKSENAGRS